MNPTKLLSWMVSLCVVCALMQPEPAQGQPANPAEEKGLAAAEAAKRKQAEADARRDRETARRAQAENERIQAENERMKRELQAFKDREAAKAAEAARAAQAAEAAKARAVAATPPPASRFRAMEQVMQVPGCEACGQMSVVEAGRYEMGSPAGEPGRDADEGPVRSVQLGRFEMARTEVTQGQWKAVMGSNPSAFNACGDACPVERVSWEDITGKDGFLAKLKEKTGVSYRLPTEAEWEYAARAGSKTAFWWGNTINPTQANYDGNDVYAGGGQTGAFRRKTVKVDAFEANAWGLYNVHGNVWEWVQDCWHGNYNGAPSTGEEWKGNCGEARRVVRGGSWNRDPVYLRSAIRNRFAPDDRYLSTGFRLARTL